jgi:hypothetical protein
VAAFAVMLVICMGAVPALWVALVCVALLCTLLPSHGSSHPPAQACFDASFSIACCLLATLLHVLPLCRFELLRHPRFVPPKVESVGGEQASLPSRIKL